MKKNLQNAIMMIILILFVAGITICLMEPPISLFFEINASLLASFTATLSTIFTGFAAWGAMSSAKASRKSANQWREQKRLDIDATAIIEARHAVADFIRYIKEKRRTNAFINCTSLEFFINGHREYANSFEAINKIIGPEISSLHLIVISKLDKCKLLGYESTDAVHQLQIIYDNFIRGLSCIPRDIESYHLDKSTESRLLENIDFRYITNFTQHNFGEELLEFGKKFDSNFTVFYNDLFKN